MPGILAGEPPVTDEARFRDLFDAHYRAIARYFRSRGHVAADADDLVAATFEVAWRRIDAVPAGDEALLWLYGVARNQSRNARRSVQREVAFVDAVAPVLALHGELAVEEREALAETMAALAVLKPEDRDLILLVSWDDLSPTDAGRVLGLRPNAARTRLHRARRRLAAALHQQQGTADPAGHRPTHTTEPRAGKPHDA